METRSGESEPRISVDPNVHFGKPCVAGTRIPVRDVLELLRAGRSVEAVTTDYYPDLEDADVQACAQYALDRMDTAQSTDRTTIQLECPCELVTLLDVPEDELGDELLLLAVLELVREEHISTGKAAAQSFVFRRRMHPYSNIHESGEPRWKRYTSNLISPAICSGRST